MKLIFNRMFKNQVVPVIKYYITILLLFTAVFFLMFSSILAGTAEKQNLNTELKLEISLEKPIYKLNESIPIRVRVHNIGSQTIWMYPPVLAGDFLIYLKHESVPKAELLEQMAFIHYSMRKENIVKLEPNDFFTFTEILDQKTYSLPDKSGDHELFAVLSNENQEFEEIKLWTGTLKSNSVKFTVVTK